MDTYERLLANAKGNPIKADFLKLRVAQLHSAQFNPYLNAVNMPMALNQLFQSTDPDQLVRGIEQVLDMDYLDIEAHIIAMNIYYRVGRFVKATFHDLFAQGLIQSILTVDGRSFATAFTVINIREEYALMRVMGFPVLAQRKSVYNGGNYDILSVQNPQTEEKLEFYFNIDLMRTHFNAVPPSDPDDLDPAV